MYGDGIVLGSCVQIFLSFCLFLWYITFELSGNWFLPFGTWAEVNEVRIRRIDYTIYIVLLI